MLEGLSNFFIGDISYAASSFLSHYILYEDRKSIPIRIEALIYSSVQAELRNINFAFHPDFVKDHIKLKGVQKVTFDSFIKGGSNLVFLEQGLPQIDGTIKWYKSGFNLNEIKAENYFAHFTIDPPVDKITDEYLFYSRTDNDYYPLPVLAWKILKKKQADVLNELAKFVGEIDFETIQKNQYKLILKRARYFLRLKA